MAERILEGSIVKYVGKAFKQCALGASKFRCPKAMSANDVGNCPECNEFFELTINEEYQVKSVDRHDKPNHADGCFCPQCKGTDKLRLTNGLTINIGDARFVRYEELPEEEEEDIDEEDIGTVKDMSEDIIQEQLQNVKEEIKGLNKKKKEYEAALKEIKNKN